tara:strand:- start:19957 stop:20544 length:588 start_codon:yes stop_codon:yes gene_type:complete
MRFLEMNEQLAIQLCLQQRDPRGFEFLVQQYRKEAFTHALALLHDRDDAADVCQESFCKAFAAISQLTQLDHFYPWFYRILRNTCLNLLSRKQTSADYRRAKVGQQEGDRPDPVDPVEKREEQAVVEHCLLGLQMGHREILIMKYVQNLKYADISVILGIPRGTVMSRLYHARQAFQELYARHDKHADTMGQNRN